MRWVRVLAASAVTAVSLVVAGSAAAASFTDTVAGIETAFFEVSPGVEVSRFDGFAVGDRPGRFSAIVTHAPLATGGAILDDGDDGDFKLVNRRGLLVTGEFTGGAVSAVSAEPGCGKQVYDVDADLDVMMGSNAGTAHVDALLTHLRTRLFGTCITYFATIKGTVAFAF
jgi:hypothetical protein